MKTLKKMNRIILSIAVLGLTFSACKTKRELAQSPYTTDPDTEQTEQKIFTVPDNDIPSIEKEEPQAKPRPAATYEKPVSMRKEQVTFTRQEDKIQNETNTFFVIIGSFSQLDNAKNYRENLLDQGFTPIILHSETGYYRVCVNSYQNERDARTRVAQIRQVYPEYSDVWLLIKD